MATGKPKVLCPECGIEMNHHASKLVHPVTPEEATAMNPVLGGLLEDCHCCPECGKGVSQQAAP